jgi:arsenate reductase
VLNVVDTVMKILFICTHNRCRSILAEAITNHISNGQLDARSAGSHPAGEVHPLTIKYLLEAGIDVESLASQSWDEFEDWHPDVVITVCDSANNEQCPFWFGNNIRIHWGLEDPSKVEGTQAQINQAFHNTMTILTNRITQLTNENFEKLSNEEIALLLTKLERLTGNG